MSINVTDAATTLGVCEFDLFRQAYANWHGDAPQDELVGRFFEIYAEDGDIPIWVRHYANEVAASELPQVAGQPMSAVA